MIDYVLTNGGMHLLQMLYVRTLNSVDVGSDRRLLLAKIIMKIKESDLTLNDHGINPPKPVTI